MKALLEEAAEEIADELADESCVWFYTGFNEAPAHQWNRMVHDSSATGYYELDNYIPSMFTQNRDSIYRADLDTTLYLPTLEEVDRTGVLSWLRYHVRLEDEDRELTNTFSIMHTITSWAGTNNLTPYYPPPTFTDQANAVRSFLSMEYQMYSIPPLPGPVDNSPDFFLVNCYPFRQVGITYQDTLPYEPTLGGELESWLLEHFEEGMDSTFITAWEFGLDQNREVSVLFNPQAFGRAGGEDMWTWDDTLSQYFVDYGSYNYRIPTPQEFLMSCNTALLRQAKGFSPHCLVSYCEASASEAGLLDQNNIPFDAPYEEWVYRDRPTDDFYFIPPDSYPPFIDSPYDFDPLYDLLDRPVDIVGWERNRENYLLWKFEPYARLWNSMRSTLGEIASVAPELSALRWWEGYEEEASIEHPGSLPIIYTTPEIRVFTDSTESICYLFYVNRQCRQATTNYTISADEGDLPEDALTTLVLDHSRRFIIPVEEDDGIYSFLDTLEAGQGRLVEFVNTPLAADIRITAPDVMARYPRTPADIRNFEFKAGDTILIIADFFNMGTSSENNVIV
ncbi:MAG: hypothetical protein K8S15_00330, partial [Candidatus Aegiribacteria sp.]|nr:hypothetical protein [Candidatus Aegiribacteria sp.]